MISDLFLILVNRDFNCGVLYLSASVGRIFKNKLTIATGRAMENAHTLGMNSIGKKPIG